MEMKKCDVESLSKVQNFFLNTILNTYKCPIPLMYLDLSILTVPFRILKAKLLFYHKVACLPENAVARKIMECQEKFEFPNLRNEISNFLTENEIVDVKDYSSKEWKELVKRKIESANRESLLESSKKYKKLEHLALALEEPNVNEYFYTLDLAGSRTKFQERAKTISTCKSHRPSDKDNLLSMFCSFCNTKSICSLSHWRNCSGYSHLKVSRNLSLDRDLVSYYMDIIELRKAELERKK